MCGICWWGVEVDDVLVEEVGASGVHNTRDGGDA